MPAWRPDRGVQVAPGPVRPPTYDSCNFAAHPASSPKAATSALRLKVAFRLFGWGFLFGSSAVVAVGYFGFSAAVKAQYSQTCTAPRYLRNAIVLTGTLAVASATDIHVRAYSRSTANR
jgi:hypothetical protein